MTKDSLPEPRPGTDTDPAASTPEPAAPAADSSATRPETGAPEEMDGKPAGDNDGVPRIHRLRIAVNVGIQLLLGLVLYGLVNYLASRHFKQWDNTYDKRFSLSPTTTEFLKKITVPLRITVLAVRGKETEKDLSALLQQYQSVMKGKLEVKVIDTLRDTAAYEAFKVQQGLKTKSAFDNNGVLVQAIVPGNSSSNGSTPRWIREAELYDMDRKTMLPQAFKGESLLNSAILGVTTLNKPLLGIVAGAGAPRRLQDNTSAWNTLDEISKLQNIDFVPCAIRDATERMDQDALIWIAPEGVTERDTALLQQYLEKPGHSLCVMLNPENRSAELDKFLALYGIVPQQDRVISVDYRTSGDLVNFLVENARFLDGHVLTNDIVSESVTLTGQTRSLKIVTDSEKQRTENIEVKAILAAPEGYWGETDWGTFSPRADKGTDNLGPVYAIAAAERGASKDPRFQMKSSRLLVFGNSGFGDPDTLSKLKYDFLNRGISWMMHRDVVAPNDSSTDKAKHKFSIQIQPGQWQRIFWTTTIILPLAALMAGLMIWSGRRS